MLTQTRVLILAVVAFLTSVCSAQHVFKHDGFHHSIPDAFEFSFQHFFVPSNSYRLNLTVIPTHYTLRMRPVLDDGFPSLARFSVPSSVEIQVESIAHQSCNTITLHQRNLTIDLENVKVTNLNTGQNSIIFNQTFEEDKDLYTINLQDAFNFGDNLTIFIPYTVHLSQTENVGIYLGHYVNPETNVTHYLSATKLEPYHARKVLPLFDEPSLKARFTISVARLANKYHSLSNMEIVQTEMDLEHDGWVWDHYDTSVMMSPYLMCVIVSDFTSDTIQIPEINRTVSAWAPKHDIDAQGGAYGSSTSVKLLDFYEKRYKMSYALRKLDAVALPQFASGAMENFGLVTYRHAYLVWIPGENTEAERRKVTQVLAHEIIHQWFGNIVTCAWWSEIWLNEGFARYMQFWGMNNTLPEFLIDESVLVDTTQLAMVFDHGPVTHPVRNTAQSTTESAAVFDRISYEKAASLLRMMESFLGRELLERGLVDIYLQKMKWKSAYQEDLFESIQEAIVESDSSHLLPNGITIGDIMAEWTLTSGYPLLRIDVVNSNTISISQEKFVLSSKKSKVLEDHWWIPVKVYQSNISLKEHKPNVWIPNNVSALTFTHEDLNTNRLLMINPDASSYYRVLYDNRLITLIKNQLQEDHAVISSSSRSQLIDDYFHFSSASYIQIESAMELTNYLAKEAASNVWSSVLVHLKPILANFTEDKEAFVAFKNYFLPRLNGALNSIGLRQSTNERGINVTLRAQLLEMACQLELPACEEYAVELMDEWMKNPDINPFLPDTRPSLYCMAVVKSNQTVWNFLLSKFAETRIETPRTALLNSLACSRNSSTLSNFLEMSLDATSALHNFMEQVLIRVAMNSEGRQMVYEFAKANLISSKITAGNFANMVSTLSAYLRQPEELQELQTFIESNGNTLEPVRNSLETSLTAIQRNIDWWSSFGKRIHMWLEENSEK